MQFSELSMKRIDGGKCEAFEWETVRETSKQKKMSKENHIDTDHIFQNCIQIEIELERVRLKHKLAMCILNKNSTEIYFL